MLLSFSISGFDLCGVVNSMPWTSYSRRILIACSSRNWSWSLSSLKCVYSLHCFYRLSVNVSVFTELMYTIPFSPCNVRICAFQYWGSIGGYRNRAAEDQSTGNGSPISHEKDDSTLPSIYDSSFWQFFSCLILMSVVNFYRSCSFQ